MQALADGTELVSDFRIERVLGAGGFGITYLAREIDLDRLVTIKEYFPGDFAMRDAFSVDAVPRSENCVGDYQWGLDRFIEEAQTLARFDHPNIVRVYRYFRANNTGYMVLHFEEGHSFKTWLTSLGRAPRQAELDQIVSPLLDALSVVHSADFLHRDIAPDNIIIRSDGSPVLIDFGAARGDIAQHSRTVSALVKPGYSPYEQYGEIGRQQGPWTDIYALAATLYHAITGKRPPDAPSRVVKDELIAAKEVAISAYRPAFLKAVDRGLRIDIEKRPQSVAEWRGSLLAPAANDSTRGWFGGRKTVEVDPVQAAATEETVATRALSPAVEGAKAPDMAIPPPPDMPGRRGRIVDFLDGVRDTPRDTVALGNNSPSPVAEQRDQEIAAAVHRIKTTPGGQPDAGPAAASANRDAPKRRFRLFKWADKPPAPSSEGPADHATTMRVIPDRPVDVRTAPNVPAKAKPKSPARRKPPKPRPVRTKSRWRWVPLLTKLAAGVVIATFLVRLQQSMPRFEFRSHGTVASAPAMTEPVNGKSESRASGRDVPRTTGSLNSKPTVRPPKERAPDRQLPAARAASSAPVPSLQSASTAQPLVRRAPESLLIRTFAAHAGGATDIAFADAGTKLATVGGDGLLKLWNAKTHKLIRTLEIEHGPAFALAVRGTRALTGHENGRVALWDLTLGMQLKTFKRNDAPITSLAFAGENRFLAGAHDWSVAIWELNTPSVPLHVFQGHGRDVLAVAYEPNRGLIASASADRTVKLWETKGLAHVRTYPKQRSFITAIAFSSDGESLLFGTLDGSVSLYSTENRRRKRRYRGHGDRVTAISFIDGGREFVSASEDGTVRLWNRRGGQPLQTFGSAGAKVARAVVSPDGRFIAAAKADGTVQIWNAVVLD